MVKSRHNSLVALKIKQGSKVVEQTLRNNEKLTIGKSPENDIIVFNEKYPKKHTLISCSNNKCTLNVSRDMQGELYYKESKLSLQDLVFQEILKKKNGFFTVDLPHGRSGRIRFGDTIVLFAFDTRTKPTIQSDYSWFQALGRSFTKDLAFKFIFLLFFALEIIFALSIRNVEIPENEPPDVDKVGDRFAKFVVRKPPPEPEPTISTRRGTAQSGTSETNQEETTERSESKPRRPRSGGAGGGSNEKSVANQGLLALIGSKGESNAGGSAAADFLVDQGLVQELDQLLGQTSLKKGKGYGRGEGKGMGDGQEEGDGIDDIMSVGLAGGIDDIISDVQQEGVEGVNLEKKGKVNIEPPGKLRGSQTAMGYRTAESVNSVIRSKYGLIMYTYEKYLRQDPNIRGKVSFDITIESNGVVSNVKMVESSISNQSLIRDLANILRRLKFESIPEGSITVNVPLLLNRAG